MKINFQLVMLLLIFLTSCSKRNLVYFSDLPENAVITEAISNVNGPMIKPNDILSISITTLNPETNQFFNFGSDDGYKVDNNGAINLPILGKIVLEDLTIDEATEKLTKLVEKEAKNPIVNISITNFNFTIVGEVANPNTYNVSSGIINIIEAIGLAGDIGPLGRRENVLLIRVKDGVRTMSRLDLNKKDIFSSPYFFLQQNDIIYVESIRAKVEQDNIARNNISLAMSVASFLLVIFLSFK